MDALGDASLDSPKFRPRPIAVLITKVAAMATNDVAETLRNPATTATGRA